MSKSPEYIAATRAAAELSTAEKVALIDYLSTSLGDGEDSTITTGENLIPGQTLLQGGSFLRVENVEPSSAMPGFQAVETPVGTLYLDPEEELLTLD